MKGRFVSAIAAFGLGAQLAAAQSPAPASSGPDPAKVEAEKANVAKHKCGELPVWPGRKAADLQRRGFETGMKTYGDCIRGYIDDRRAVIRANEAVARTAIEDYNSALEAARADVAAGTKPEVK